ncbi:5'-deoxynucleotidase Ygk1p [[Candida] railenensis]|uniref:5'-deoxynucleotidase n=1 Tax=[Candida] railenensis TaxID=45579 RepID=A0A9P0W1P4_9ASCO|nr:5'-deoxynucleotidase Ygk1p [[Candida] railenensis]
MSSEKSSSEKLWMPQEVVPEHIKKLLSPADSSSKRVNYVLAFIQIVRLLKTQKRTGWVDHKVPTGDVESISDHMYRMSIISLLITNEEVNKDKCVKIAIVHDLAETLVGDITPFDGVEKSEKSRREFETIKYLASIIKEYNAKAAEEIVELWLDYEEIRCLEARYVKDIDKYEMIQQAWDYEQQFGTKHNLDMFYSARSAIKTPEISELTDELIKQRTSWLSSQK